MTAKLKTAMVLAAGLGTRMRPLTDSQSKPMVRLKGRPLIDHVLDQVAAAGIGTAVVNVHHFPDQLAAHLAPRRKPAIRISDERGELLDTGGGVVRALPLIGNGPFLIHNSDSVWVEGVGSNLARLIDRFDPRRMDCLMLLASAATSIGYDGLGDFTMDANGKIERRGERRTAPFVFAGVSIASPALFEGAPKGRFSLNTVWDQASERGRLFGIRLDGVWMHIGTPDALEAAERWLDREHNQ